MNKFGFIKAAAFSTLAAAVIFTGSFMRDAKADEENSVIKLKFICTTDIHGQITSKDQESGIENVYGGMEKMYTVIKKEREGMDPENVFTFDCGDILSDFTTQVVYDTDEAMLQPVFNAYKKVGYDAFVLGNHEFDFGFSYIKNQLNMAELNDKCVVSNLTTRATREYPFLPSLMLNRTVTAEDGSDIAVKIGVIGETTPSMSSKTEVLSGAFRAEDIVENARKTAKKLRAEGADIVVALAHSGFGEPEPALLADDASYALTKIKDIDIVFAGHQHKVYPDNPISDHYSYEAKVTEMPGVNKKTKLVNGKPLVMAGCRGDYVGVVDLKCRLKGERLDVIGAEPRNIKVNPKLVTASKEISESIYGDFLKVFNNFATTVIAKTDKNITYQNYYGMLKDNDVNQLLNNSKMAFGLKYIHSRAGAPYKDYPVIGSSAYYSYGYKTGNDYVDFTGEIRGGDIAMLQYHHVYLKVYRIYGAQLREYMEWTAASAYTRTNSKSDKKDNFMSVYSETTGLTPLIYPDWASDWSQFRVFDGVEYKIDPSVEPRYNKDGKKINDTNRIVSLTVNGNPVKDDDEFILVSDKIFSKNEITDEIINQMLIGGYVNPQKNIMDYLKESYKAGPISTVTDDNWSFIMPAGYRFLTGVYKKGDGFVKKDSWYKDSLISDGINNYYMGEFRESGDTTGPELIATKNITEVTNNDIKIAVQANDISGVKEIRYLKGEMRDYSADSRWNFADVIKERYVVATHNGTYTFRALDNLNNASYYTVVVDNIDRTIANIPEVETYTNRKSAVRGYADVNSTVHVIIGGRSYQAETASDGRFVCELPFQNVGTEFKVYAVDERGKKSETLNLQVKRTGPNRPEVHEVTEKQESIRINAYDADAVPVAIYKNTVYATADAYAKFKESDKYKQGMRFEECELETVKGNSFYLYMDIPGAGEKITIYTVDSLNRASVKRTVTVKE